MGEIRDRFRSMGVTGTPMLAGHVAASVVRSILATAMVLSVALLIGFRPAADPLAWLAAAGLLLAYLVAVSWLAAGVGLLARTPEGASGFTFFLMFLPYPSSAFVPIETMHYSTSGQAVMMALLGGMGTFFGPFVGAATYALLQDGLATVTSHWQLFVGAIFIAFVLFLPLGIWGEVLARLRRAGW